MQVMTCSLKALVTEHHICCPANLPARPQAEVHSVMSDGGVVLHARSLQFGKLENGTLVRLPASLVPRQKQHVVSLPAPFSCDVVIGVNGWAFLTGSLGLGGSEAGEAGSGRGDSLAIADELAEAIEARKRAAAATPATPPQRRAIAALRRTLLFLAREGRLVTFEAAVTGAAALIDAESAAAAEGGAGGPGGAAGAGAGSSIADPDEVIAEVLRGR